jgi:luciferase family oxidoreductase group 1
MIPFSILDLSSVVEGSDVRHALANSLDLARQGERLGYKRFWVAEHHNMLGVASSATSVVIAHVGQGTSRIRVGAGGIMLPNHAPMQIAEQFGTLDALFPGRVDLGLGRAPGTDQLTARALRRTLNADPDNFPNDVAELMAFLEPAVPNQAVRAVPGEGANVELWILGSSLFGAQVAAHFGLPFAFASHFAPAQLMDAARIYRERFKPSETRDKPHFMAGVSVIAADTDEEAKYLSSSGAKSLVNLLEGRPARLPPPEHGFELPPQAQAMRGRMGDASAIGSPDTVREKLRTFLIKSQADELILSAQIYDHAARVRSFEIVADLGLMTRV